MKIYINEQHQIQAVRVNPAGDLTLTEIEVEEDFLSQFCDTVKCGFCHEITRDDAGEVIQVATYPYIDLCTLEAIQRQYEANQKLFSEQLEAIIDNDYRLSLIELGLN